MKQKTCENQAHIKLSLAVRIWLYISTLLLTAEGFLTGKLWFLALVLVFGTQLSTLTLVKVRSTKPLFSKLLPMNKCFTKVLNIGHKKKWLQAWYIKCMQLPKQVFCCILHCFRHYIWTLTFFAYVYVYMCTNRYVKIYIYINTHF